MVNQRCLEMGLPPEAAEGIVAAEKAARERCQATIEPCFRKAPSFSFTDEGTYKSMEMVHLCIDGYVDRILRAYLSAYLRHSPSEGAHQRSSQRGRFTGGADPGRRAMEQIQEYWCDSDQRALCASRLG